jgi:hypothetical protein
VHKQVVALYEGFKHTPFPAVSSEEEAAELHAELALLDTGCNGLIAMAIGGDLSSKESLTSYEWRLDDLRIRLQSMIREGNRTAASDARCYLDYLGTLREVVRLVTSTSG